MIRLSNAIENLREELAEAQEQGKGKALQFDVGTIEIELEVVAEKEIAGNGKINWWIVESGVDTKASKTNTHKLKLTLQTVASNGKPLRVSQQQQERPE